MKRFFFVALLAACDCSEPASPVVEAPPLTPADLFPMHAGDRWANESEGEGDPERSLLVVTAVTPEGVGVFFGDDRTSAERYRVSVQGVELVAPDGTVLAPYLDAPVALAHEWSYELGDTRCVATYATVGETAEVASTRLEGCVEVRRRCELPAGKPFPNATAQIHEELWCPNVGRVRESVRFRPAPTIEGFPAEKTWALRYYRVQDAPALALPEPLDCAHFLIAATDVQAACGPALRFVGAADVDGSCRARFTGSGGVLEVRARRFDAAPDATALDALLLEGDERAEVAGELRVIATAVDAAPNEAAPNEAAPNDATGGPTPNEVRPNSAPEGPTPNEAAPNEAAPNEAAPNEAAPSRTHGFALVEGPVGVALRAHEAVCPAERARRLEPLLRSLVRR
ncbi:MAG: hypothetical protein MUE69_19370 [Myxococcota bacterium]|nr:hypothetical protein [Myxococcota bacterium]